MVEHLTLNQGVQGSSPWWCTKALILQSSCGVGAFLVIRAFNFMDNKLLTGPIRRTLLQFAVPIMCSMLAGQLYTVADSVIIGRFLDAQALAAVSNGSTIMMVFLFISGGMELGCGLLVAAKQPVYNKEEMSRLLYNLLFLDAVIAVLMMLIGFPTFTLWLKLIRTPEEILQGAAVYGRIYLLFLLFQMVYDVSRELMIGMGDSASPMLLMIATSLLNVALDILLVPVWGLAGAALATGLAQLLGCMIILFLLSRKYLLTPFSLSLLTVEYGRDILRLAPPNAIQQASGMVITMVKQSLLGGLGAMAIAGFSCANKVTTLMMMPVYGFTQALVIFIAQNESAGQEQRIRRAVKDARGITMLYITLVVACCICGAGLLIGLFTEDKEAICYGALMLTWEPAANYFYGLRLMNEAQLRGRQRMGRYMVSSIGAIAVNMVSCLLLVPRVGYQGFYISSYISTVSSLLASVVLTRGMGPRQGTT